jgi:hypothetical protein
MQSPEDSTPAALALLSRLGSLEAELQALPRETPDLPSIELWRKTEGLLTDYVQTVVKLVQINPSALFGRRPIPHHPAPDLSRYTEHTRAALYNAVVAIHWDFEPEHPEDSAPDYTPDEAGLQVVFLLGRWFAVWRMLEEPEDVPLSQRWNVLAIDTDPDSPHGLSFTAV